MKPKRLRNGWNGWCKLFQNKGNIQFNNEYMYRTKIAQDSEYNKHSRTAAKLLNEQIKLSHFKIF